uniref:dTDP-4-dehydrorhamnose 3,5-epimerase n=1 Tax=Meloidogyne incognita TaxID=6306 RepID=A0A914LBA4_MELIC
MPQVVKRISPEIETLSTIEGLKLIKQKVFPDERGFFSESYNAREWKEALGFDERFLQDNHSYSKFGVIRGLHAQKGMGKLVSVLAGSIFDVAIDARLGSPTFGKWHGIVLDAKEKTSFWIPDGFLHGFQCISEEGAHVVYKCTSEYDKEKEFGVDPFDEQIGIVWPVVDKSKWVVSERDRKHPSLSTLNGVDK